VAYGELVTIETPEGCRTGQVLQIQEDLVIIQVFDGTLGLGEAHTTIWLEQDVVRVPVGKSLIGKVLNGRGEMLTGEPLPFASDYLEVTGQPLNPERRRSPHAFIETGISTIDLTNSLVLGQKLPIFTGAGLPSNELAAQIVSYSRVPGTNQPFLVVFAAMGITRREANFFLDAFRKNGALSKGVFFMNLASDSAAERLLTPRMALTVAEYFAYQMGYHVLVVLTDMLHYCEALREIGAAREEIPGRRGYPGYMYSDLSTIYERAGCVKNSSGSITQIPMVSMPDDDMTHPVVDLTGYITEGQIVLGRALQRKGTYPPVDILPSLSRLMNKGIGKEKTFPEHRALADQIYASYARARELEQLRIVIGDDALSPLEKRYLRFGKIFEESLVHQEGRRTLEETVQRAWHLLGVLPKEEIYRLPRDVVERMHKEREM
jgi:V/A-type H+-transporting ATPase subunit B